MTWRTWMAFAALCVIWGVPYFFIKLALVDVSPFVLAWSRLTLGALVLLPIAWHRGALRAVKGHWSAISVFAFVEYVVPFSAISYGEQWISSSVTGILIAAVPLTIAVLSRFFGVHERLSAWRLSGLILGFVGVATLVGFGTISTTRQWIGVGCMLLATIGYAIGPLIIQRHLRQLDSAGPAAGSMLVASVLLLVPALLTFPSRMPSTTALASIGILGCICSALAMLLMFYLVSHAGAARAAVITYINPVVATLLGTVQLHERLGLGGYVAFALILLGSWLATRGAPQHGEAVASEAAA